MVAKRSTVLEQRLEQVKETQFQQKTSLEQMNRLATDTCEQQKRLVSDCERLNASVIDVKGTLVQSRKEILEKVDGLELSLETKIELLDAGLVMLTTESKRDSKRLGDDANENKQHLAAQLAVLNTEVTTNLEHKIKTLESQIPALEAGIRDVMRLQMDVHECKELFGDIPKLATLTHSIEDKLEALARDSEKSFSELAVDVQVLQVFTKSTL